MIRTVKHVILLVCALYLLPAHSQQQLHVITTQTPQDINAFFKYTADRIPFVSAHRGGAAPGFPENSIPTFERTLSNTYAIMEVDPRYTKDGEMVLMHDVTVDRTTTGTGKVAELTLAEIKNLFLTDTEGNPTPFAAPSLDEALQWAIGKTILVLDAKGIHGVERAKKVVENNAIANAILIIYSFQEALEVYQYNPDIIMQVIVSNEEDLAKFAKSRVPFENVVAFVTHQQPKEEIIFEKLNEKNLMAIRGTSFSLDRAYTKGEISYDALLEGYRNMINAGADIIEADLATAAGEALRVFFDERSSKSKFFATIPK